MWGSSGIIPCDYLLEDPISSKSETLISTAALSPVAQVGSLTVKGWLQFAQLRYEKCELGEAREAYEAALKLAKRTGDSSGMMEALSGLLRSASDALDSVASERWERELSAHMNGNDAEVPAMAWYCRGVVSRRQNRWIEAQRSVHRYLKEVRKLPASHSEDAESRGWVMLAMLLWNRGHKRRAEWLCHWIAQRFDDSKHRGATGLAFLVLGNICESSRDFDGALGWYHRAHGSFLKQHHWYYYLYVLYAYARVYRMQENFTQARLYLDLLDQATDNGTLASDFAYLRREVESERLKLDQDTVDVAIDSRQCILETREKGVISIGKQYVLLHILEELVHAHRAESEEHERGLSKAEIIRKVWKDKYRPEAHDNKLYYNINRLRKLIEPDIRKPKYLLNWKDGYRLAPGLRVRWVGGGFGSSSTHEKNQGNSNASR